MRTLQKVLATLICLTIVLLLAGMGLRDPADPGPGPELSSLSWEAADGGPLSEDEVSAAGATVTVATDRAVIFHGTGAVVAARIAVLPSISADITLDNVCLQPAMPEDGSGLSALELGGWQTVKLTVKGENILKGAGPAPAVSAGGESAALTIASVENGTLEAAAG